MILRSCFIFILFLITFCPLSAQENLILNPGFEEYITCPTALEQFDGYVKDWRSWHSTPNFNHFCGFIDNILPYEGSGLASVLMYTNRFAHNWEYIQTRLKEPLKADTPYYLEFQAYTRNVSFSIRQFQAFFSDSWYTVDFAPDKLHLDLIPQFNSTQPLSTVVNAWILKSGCFQVQVPHQYMLIGNFAGTETDTFSTSISALTSLIRFDNFALYEVETLSHIDTTICPGSAYRLPSFGLSGLYYIMNEDTLSSDLPFTVPGTYEIEQHLDGCGIFNNFTLTVKPCDSDCFPIPSDISICPFTTLDLTGDLTYLLNDEEIESGWMPPHPGSFVLQVQNEFCDLIGSRNIEVMSCDICFEYPVLIDSVCIGDRIELPEITGLFDLVLSIDGEEIPDFDFRSADTGDLQVNYQSTVCSWDLNYFVHVAPCQACQIFLPQAFSPNKDGINDQYKAYSPCAIEKYRFQIFDRWGTLIFKSELENEGWNGMMNGKDLHPGIYTYMLTGSVRDGMEYKGIVLSGEFQLFR